MKISNILILLTLALSFINCKKNSIPEDVTLATIAQDEEGIHLSWSQSDDKHFMTYKVYKSKSSNVSWQNGELVYYNASLDSNFFTDTDFSLNETLYYQVYVDNKAGVSNGSNVESIVPVKVNILENGSFEDGQYSEPNNWYFNPGYNSDPLNHVARDLYNFSSGSKSIVFKHTQTNYCNQLKLSQSLYSSNFEEGRSYSLSFDYKSSAPIQANNNSTAYLSQGQNQLNISLDGFVNDGEWHTNRATFEYPVWFVSSSVEFSILFCVDGEHEWYIDNVNISEVQ